MQHMNTALIALTSYEATDVAANSRKKPLEAWKRVQKRDDPTTGGRKRNLLRMMISWTVLSSRVSGGDRTMGVVRVPF